jgi:hypothetical protein
VFSVVAILAAYNESDIVEQVVRDLIDQDIRVYFLDDGSTDDTASIVERYLNRGVLAVERSNGGSTPQPRFEWERILRRKSQLAHELDATWFIHHDADEFRESPWSHLSLNDAIRRVDELGFNAIDFASLDFWPVRDDFQKGDDVRQAMPFYSFRAPYDRLQVRCWKKTDAMVDLASSGGHEARFPGRRVFPVRFILRHYPIRSQAHGERKVLQERQRRFLADERNRGWHVQYDDVDKGTSFIRDPATLTRYNPDLLRVSLTLRHRGVEALEEEIDIARQEREVLLKKVEAHKRELDERALELQCRSEELAAKCVEAAALRSDLETRSAELEAWKAEAGTRTAEIERWRAAVADYDRRLAEFQRSLSWRWTSPARTAYRLLRGR